MWRCCKIRGDKIECLITFVGIFICYGFIHEQLINYKHGSKASRILDDVQHSFSFRDFDANTVFVRKYWAHSMKDAITEIRVPNVICPEHNAVMVVIHSHAENTHRRQILRDMWRSVNISPIFVVGRSDAPGIYKQVLDESYDHNDMLIGGFIDSHRNSSLKSLLSLKFFRSTNCDTIKWLIKCEDDVFANITNLINICNGSPADIVCQMWEWLPAQRNASNKWHITIEQYPFRVFPSTCSPRGYLLSSHAAVMLYEYSKVMPYIWFEPGWITGLLAHRAALSKSQIYSNTFYTIPTI